MTTGSVPSAAGDGPPDGSPTEPRINGVLLLADSGCRSWHVALVNNDAFHMTADRIALAANAIEAFATAFLAVDVLDTTEEERRRLVEVDGLLTQALERFQ